MRMFIKLRIRPHLSQEGKIMMEMMEEKETAGELKKILMEMLTGNSRNRILRRKLELRYRPATAENPFNRLLLFRRGVFPSTSELLIVRQALEAVLGHVVGDAEVINYKPHHVMGYLLLWKPAVAVPAQLALIPVSYVE